MIPVGNWEETNDELRNEIADLEQEVEILESEKRTLEIEKEELQSALNAADTDIADYLFELDHLHSKNMEMEEDAEGLLVLVEYWQEKAHREEIDQQNAFVIEADLWRARYEDLGREFRDYKIVHPENERQIEYWRNRAIESESQAQIDWERANDLETYSISIEEARELTNRNLDLEDQLNEAREMRSANFDAAVELNRELTELKAALRTLGGEKEN